MAIVWRRISPIQPENGGIAANLRKRSLLQNRCRKGFSGFVQKCEFAQ